MASVAEEGHEDPARKIGKSKGFFFFLPAPLSPQWFLPRSGERTPIRRSPETCASRTTKFPCASEILGSTREWSRTGTKGAYKDLNGDLTGASLRINIE